MNFRLSIFILVLVLSFFAIQANELFIEEHTGGIETLARIITNKADSLDSLLVTNAILLNKSKLYTETAIKTEKIILNIFINPDTNEILIYFKSLAFLFTDIKWFDHSGNLIFSQNNLRANENGELSLKIAAKLLHLKKGSYSVLVKNNGETYIKTLIFY